MCRAAQEASTAHREYNKGRKYYFSHLCSSVIPYLIGAKFATEVPPGGGVYIPSLKRIAPDISEV